jgi:two-component system, sensor histidine kinase and response regulator
MSSEEKFLQQQSVILIVDDNNKNLQVLGSILKESHYKVAVAKDGPSAISLASKINPDLILLDVMMPGMSGFEACAKMKSMENTRNIPIIFLSARNESSDIVQGFTAGGVDYVTKPFIKEELLARIRNHLLIKYTEEELKEMIAAKDKFFSIIAHDLKNPIASLVSLVDMLETNLDRYDHQKLQKLLKGISEAAHTQYKLQENLLEWSRIQTGSIKVNLTSFNLAEAIMESMDASKGSALTKNIDLQYDGENWVFVMADRYMIDTVLRNIISNAIKFSYKNSKVLIKCSKKETVAEVSVTDHGIGISDENIDAIFKIKTGSMLGTNKEKGTGLGLVVCKEFIEKNEGGIKVESEEGKGSVFTFTLPLDK